MDFIAVVGKSGVGKTTLINELIKNYPGEYKRAKSYTTRPRREDDKGEYDFVTDRDLKRMLADGDIRYIDCAFGYMYAMDKDVFSENEFHYIKEIHPSNIDNIKKNCKHVIVATVLSDEIASESRGRVDEYNYNDFVSDIIFYYNRHQPLEDSARDFHRKIRAVKLQKDLLIPSTNEIDKINKIGYNTIAGEFTDHLRVTTANFHETSAQFFIDNLKALSGREKVLEIGSGNGWLSSLYGRSIPSIDISDKMGCGISKITASASLISEMSNQYDVIFASLCDPFLYPVAIAEMVRILKTNGKIIISCPSYEWMCLSRNGRKKTKFVTMSGYEVEVYSFIYSQQEIENIGKILGYRILKYDSFPIGDSQNVISSAILQPCKTAGIDYKSFNIVDCYILTKEL